MLSLVIDHERPKESSVDLKALLNSISKHQESKRASVILNAHYTEMNEEDEDAQALEQPSKKLKTEHHQDVGTAVSPSSTSPDLQASLEVSAHGEELSSSEPHSSHGSPKRVRKPKVFFEPDIGAIRKRKSVGSSPRSSPKGTFDGSQLPAAEQHTIPLIPIVSSTPARSESIDDFTTPTSTKHSPSIPHELIKRRDRGSSRPRAQGRRPASATKSASKLSLVMGPDDFGEEEATPPIEVNDDMEVKSSPVRGTSNYVYDIPDSSVTTCSMTSPWLLTEDDYARLAAIQAKVEEETTQNLLSSSSGIGGDSFGLYRSQMIESRQQHAKRFIEEHDTRIRELFHLELYENILTFDKRDKKDTSGKLQQYLETYDLWFRNPDIAPPPSLKYPATLREYLTSFVWIDEEETTTEALEQRAKVEAEIDYRAYLARKQGLLDGNIALARRKPAAEPVHRKTHIQYMVDEMIFIAKAAQEERKWKISMARKLAKAVVKFFDERAAHMLRLEKDEEKQIRKIAKLTALEVKKRWNVVEAIVRARWKQLLDVEESKAGKRRFDAIIEHSKQMLNAQRMSQPVEANAECSENDTDSEQQFSQADAASDDYQETDNEDEANAMDIDQEDDESDDGEVNELDREADMPLEELRARNGGYQVGMVPDPSLDDDDDDDDGRNQEQGDEEREDEEVNQDTYDNNDNGEEEDSKVPSNIRHFRSNKPEAENDSESGVQLSSGTSEADEEDDDDEDDQDDFEDEKEQPDDEATLDADEQASDSDDDELKALHNDADVPLENLLGVYRPDTLPQPADSSKRNGIPKTNGIYSRHGKSSGATVASSRSRKAVAQNEDYEASFYSAQDDTAIDSDAIMNDAPTTDQQVGDRDDHNASHDEPDISDADAVVSGSEVAAPTGTTLNSTMVRTQVPFLLKHSLREYQHVGLDWMANLYRSGLNGILADEMGLGKTIQTISLLAWLAIDKGIWGPHLIIVPTSVLLNWECEFKKWCPGLKILTYYGNPKERKEKRVGWSKPNAFHVVITSYQLVLQDHVSFRRKAWQYLILDEAHNIKNFRSQRWQSLLMFNTRRRLLLTGTPLQNNLMELWSLLYFLMPKGIAGTIQTGFANQKEFQEWFSNPMDKLIETTEAMDEATRGTVSKLHTVLRPFILRRLKADVEKQMPGKYEHILYCRLSARQRFLYDDFLSRAETKEDLASGNYMSIINCLMQLRKVCNHPDLFEVRPITTSFIMSNDAQQALELEDFWIKRRLLKDQDDKVDLDLFKLSGMVRHERMGGYDGKLIKELDCSSLYSQAIDDARTRADMLRSSAPSEPNFWKLSELVKSLDAALAVSVYQQMKQRAYVNRYHSMVTPLYGWSLRKRVRDLGQRCIDIVNLPATTTQQLFEIPDFFRDIIVTHARRAEEMRDVLKHFAFLTPRARVNGYVVGLYPPECESLLRQCEDATTQLVHTVATGCTIAFPDRRLLQYDCGKLQALDSLLRRLKAMGSRVLIFTQMTKMLDVLEQFLNIHGHRYLRLDGATKVEQRQVLMERFNTDKRILVFILSTRSGGLGLNLTGADSVVFYDSDWNPAMDAQAQDRAHRIGQTRDVHIYRLISEHTIEENMLKKANQKRLLDSIVIQKGAFTTEYSSGRKADWRDWLGDGIAGASTEAILGQDAIAKSGDKDWEQALAAAEDENDVAALKQAQREVALERQEENDDFEEVGPNLTSNSSSKIQTSSQNESETQEEYIGAVEEYMFRHVVKYWHLAEFIDWREFTGTPSWFHAKEDAEEPNGTDLAGIESIAGVKSGAHGSTQRKTSSPHSVPTILEAVQETKMDMDDDDEEESVESKEEEEEDDISSIPPSGVDDADTPTTSGLMDEEE
ncbi:hypothetical protein SeMB42_g01787 [Synchytrium endobioticum]|uniref:Uncharacterized protein n=1 Tax=Synchytrium endobioticum TaxID=286115 RepID=A0A507DLX4_9FUNG|nr:hypothetical protein SeLEV6574_g02513 [Synchytrium endobioticum]TPX51900.1 hypothetical protein SeMB42_g01787 [Synchytrium endobioticum]